MAPRTYTPEEANAALDRVRPLVARISASMAHLPELQEEVRTAEYRMRRTPGLGAEAFERARADLRAAEEAVLEALAGLEELGVRLKDPWLGLVDFLSYREGELVELCWRLGEDRVRYWHRIGDGYPGRRPL
ncbi:MAG TPA: DUF2203 domain-containing protein [Candidatus Dormibacteraeota bacterium]|nr:DUF2203 domain-containing protein [Candidatus Dormibacteraeota bacterium]